MLNRVTPPAPSLTGSSFASPAHWLRCGKRHSPLRFRRMLVITLSPHPYPIPPGQEYHVTSPTSDKPSSGMPIANAFTYSGNGSFCPIAIARKGKQM